MLPLLIILGALGAGAGIAALVSRAPGGRKTGPSSPPSYGSPGGPSYATPGPKPTGSSSSSQPPQQTPAQQKPPMAPTNRPAAVAIQATAGIQKGVQVLQDLAREGGGFRSGAELGAVLGGLAADTQTGREAAKWVGGGGTAVGTILSAAGAFAGASSIGIAAVAFDVVFVVVIAIDRFSALAETIRWQELGRSIAAAHKVGAFEVAWRTYMMVAPGISEGARRAPAPEDKTDHLGGAWWPKWQGYPGPPYASYADVQRWPSIIPEKIAVRNPATNIKVELSVRDLMNAAADDLVAARKLALDNRVPGRIVVDGKVIVVTEGPRDVRGYTRAELPLELQNCAFVSAYGPQPYCNRRRDDQPGTNSALGVFLDLSTNLAKAIPWLGPTTYSYGVKLKDDAGNVVTDKDGNEVWATPPGTPLWTQAGASWVLGSRADLRPTPEELAVTKAELEARREATAAERTRIRSLTGAIERAPVRRVTIVSTTTAPPSSSDSTASSGTGGSTGAYEGSTGSTSQTDSNTATSGVYGGAGGGKSTRERDDIP